MNIPFYGAALCVLCIGAFIGYVRKKTEKRKIRLINLEIQYKQIQIRRQNFELEYGTGYPAFSDPEYQELIRREASVLIYIMTHFPETYVNLEHKVASLMEKMDDQKIS